MIDIEFMIMKNIQSIRGMHDYLPKEILAWQYIENVLKIILNSYGYNEIRFPIVEFTELFKRSVGEITDIFEKEMYSFYDKNGDNLTLRPEGTSGCVRAGIKNSLFYHQDQRLWYLGPMFRRDRPQKGRYRQFHQFSAEAFGQPGPDIDAELILIANRFWKKLGIDQHLTLEINSIGLLKSRLVYKQKLVKFLEKNRHNLDSDVISRLYSNPMRILDSKNEKIKKIIKKAPILQDYLDLESKSHFNKLCQLLDLFKISYVINPYLVRGLDYYNRTVFEWTTPILGSKKTICAGGRYDDLIKQLGGGLIPAVGFSVGLERLLLLIQIIKSPILDKDLYLDIYIVNLDIDTQEYALIVSEYIRDALPHLKLIVNYGGGTFKQQLNRAYKNCARFVFIIDKQNFLKKTIVLQDLRSKIKETIRYDAIVSRLKEIL